MNSKRKKPLLIAAVAGGAAMLLVAMLMGGGDDEVAVVEQPQEAVLVAATDFPVGTRISASSLQWREIGDQSVSPNQISRVMRPDANFEIDGYVVLQSMRNGEAIDEQKLLRAEKGVLALNLPKGKRAVSVEMTVTKSAGGFVLPGNRVDIILTREFQVGDEGQTSYESTTILENIQVLAIDQTALSEEGEKSIVTEKAVTLELALNESELITQAQQMGTLSLALRSILDNEAESGISPNLVRNSTSGVSVLRYGITSRDVTAQ